MPCSAGPDPAGSNPGRDGDVSGQEAWFNVPEHHQHSLNAKELKYWNHF